ESPVFLHRKKYFCDFLFQRAAFTRSCYVPSRHPVIHWTLPPGSAGRNFSNHTPQITQHCSPIQCKSSKPSQFESPLESVVNHSRSSQRSKRLLHSENKKRRAMGRLLRSRPGYFRFKHEANFASAG